MTSDVVGGAGVVVVITTTPELCLNDVISHYSSANNESLISRITAMARG